MRTLHLLSASALTMAVLAAPMVLTPTQPARAQFGVGVSITVAPPPLPIYEQPPLPAPGYLWTPGYWNYAEAGYYWVPGTWVEPPAVGLLWTPGYWGFNNGIYVFNRGYWGSQVGFYGGINYGFGYGGFGFQGGEWRGGGFFYNHAVNNFGGVHVTNVYNRTVINNTTVNRVSFNGPRGMEARPTPEQQAFAREQHVQPTALQQQHQQIAASNPELRASVNHGNPALAATARPTEFRGPGVVPAREGSAALARPGEAGRPGEAARPGDVGRPGEPSAARPALQRAGEAPMRAGDRVGETRPALHTPSSPVHTSAPVHMAPRPMGMAHPGGMAPRPMGGPRPMGPAPHPGGGAPHAAPAPHGGGEEHGPHH